ncbi:hypothetical protein B0H13DRAFT_2572277 [Mycena leptocephala]|nr:hypothetical protein B0H13DRAFT_2572277 [Mycena leptocephala]
MQREILPTVGACGVFIIDPVASFDPETQKDPEAIAACKRLMNKKYVVFISEWVIRPMEPHNECLVHFILQGEPKSNPEDCMEPSMSVPIVPMTMAIEAHPSSRNPLKTLESVAPE